MEKVFIAIPVNKYGYDRGRITRERFYSYYLDIAFSNMRSQTGESVEVIDTMLSFDIEEFNRRPLTYVGKCIKNLSSVTAVLFMEGWEEAKECRIIHKCAEEYKLKRYYVFMGSNLKK